MKRAVGEYIARLREVARNEPEIAEPRTYVRAALTFGLFLSIIGVVVLAIWWSGLRVSLTGSLPEGVYSIVPSRTVSRFDLIVFCPSRALVRIGGAILEDGPCPSGRDPMMKMVVAVGGDEVYLRGDAVVVNGVPLPGCGHRLRHDSFGRPVPSLPFKQGRLAPRAVFLCGLSDRSWDSRYFGPITLPAVFAKASPLVTRDWGWGRANGWRTRYTRRYPKHV